MEGSEYHDLRTRRRNLDRVEARVGQANERSEKTKILSSSLHVHRTPNLTSSLRFVALQMTVPDARADVQANTLAALVGEVISRHHQGIAALIHSFAALMLRWQSLYDIIFRVFDVNLIVYN